MKVFAAALALATGAAAAYKGNVTYVTDVVTAYTTYCPAATTLTYGSQTYTVTKATTLTITNCPCTITRPVYSSVICKTCTSPVYTTPVAPPPPPPYTSKGVVVTPPVVTPPAVTPPAVTSAAATPAPPAPYTNGTAPPPYTSAAAQPGKPSPSGGLAPSAVTSSSPIATGAANKAMGASAAGLAGLLGVAAYFL